MISATPRSANRRSANRRSATRHSATLRAPARRSHRWFFLFAVGALAVGAPSCASNPRPRVLGQAEAAAESPAAREARELAPQAHAQAEKLRKDADAAHARGDFSAAQILGEHSLAAYEHAFVLARYSKAEQRLAQAEQAKSQALAELTRLDEQQLRLAAEADALELKIKVTVDKEPIGSMPAASPERVRARKEAARALASEARLLCLATELLEPKREGLEAAKESVGTLESELQQGSNKDTLFPRATEARARCLKLLTLARRPATQSAPEAAVTDRLFVELTETQKFFAFRDDRGIVVSLRGLVSPEGKLTEDGSEHLALLGRTAKANPSFPLLVVHHSAKEAEEKTAGARIDLVAQALRDAGAPQVSTHSAGTARPVADGRLPEAAARNARVEIVFVSPAR